VEEIAVRTGRRTELVDVTPQLQDVVRRSGLREGVLVAQSLHTTAALTINENADLDVARDVAAKLDRMAPQDEPYYRHAEGTATAT
jgi:secondary thiamine-phosphate synthase enzyme